MFYTCIHRTMQNHNCSSFNPLQAEPLWKFKYQVSPLLLVIKAWKPVGSRSNLDTSPAGAAGSLRECSHIISWYKMIQGIAALHWDSREKKSRSTYAISAEIDQSELIFIRIPSSAATAYWIRWEYCEHVKPHIKQQLVGPYKYDPSPTTNMQLLSKFMLEGCTKCGSHSKLESG